MIKRCKNFYGIEVTVNGETFTISAAAYKLTGDKMAFVSDEIGMTIDSRIVDRADMALWKMTEEA